VVLPVIKDFPIQTIDSIQSISLKDACIRKIEELILAGDLAPGERLPSKRDLAVRLGVSRPVLHQAIVALDAKGLLRIEPRHGVFVCDFKRDGSIALLMTLMQHSDGVNQPQMLTSLIQARLHIETETARLAAMHRTEADLIEFQSLLKERLSISPNNIPALVEMETTSTAYQIKQTRNLSPRIQWLRDYYFQGVNRRWNMRTNLISGWRKVFPRTGIFAIIPSSGWIFI
jgi:DNA-binding transcriptional regulator YhcF (GntR family)